MGYVVEALSKMAEKVEITEDDVIYPWERAKKLLDNFSVPLLGERLALAALCEVICYVHFPDQKTTHLYVTKAEAKIPEILGINPEHEIHMDEATVMLRYLDEGRTIEEIRASWCSARV